MTLLTFFLLSVAGGVGAVARLFIDAFVTARLGNRYPFGTTIINITGSFLLGLVAAAATPSETSFRLIIGMGLIGGYTTFSTASFETVRLLRARRIGAALSNGFGMLLVCVLAGCVGSLAAGAFY
ncbi:MAG: fluoride efflux transporter CrcB [Microbacteriaceae bacterium]|nr:fluoride efflux transporter CrcB [Microbacteriaceae bacterium]